MRLKSQKYSTVQSKPYFTTTLFRLSLFLQLFFHRSQLSLLYEKTNEGQTFSTEIQIGLLFVYVVYTGPLFYLTNIFRHFPPFLDHACESSDNRAALTVGEQIRSHKHLSGTVRTLYNNNLSSRNCKECLLNWNELERMSKGIRLVEFEILWIDCS
jgi:hypothetical protein